MRQPHLLLSISGLCLLVNLSCGVEQPEGLRVSPQHGGGGAKPPAARPVFGEPILLGSSPYALVPFWMYTPQVQGKFDSFSISGGFSGGYSSGFASASTSLTPVLSGYVGSPSLHWNNLAFCERASGKCRLLLDRRAVICRAYFPDPAASGPPRPLLFGIAENDTNGDGFINAEDAVLLYAADANGMNLTPLTPPETQLAGIVAEPGGEAIYVRALRSSSKDHRFGEGDEVILLHIDLRRPFESKPVLDDETRRRAEAIIEGK
jgi:hypothetical protein